MQKSQKKILGWSGPLKGVKVMQEFKVLNATTYEHVLLGRDFLSKFHTVEFNFHSNSIKLGPCWYKCVPPVEKTLVRLQNAISSPSLSETLIDVKCSPAMSLITADFEQVADNEI